MKWLHWTDHSDLPKDPILVEGLPGIGHVGQLVAEHLVQALQGTLVAEIHSPDFPPQAIVTPEGVARLCSLRLWAVSAQGGAPPLAILTGDSQALSPHGQFEITRGVLDRLAEAGCSTVYTLGGVGGREKEPRVLAAAATKETVGHVREAGAEVDEMGPEGGIVGASGVFLGLAGARGMTAACLMGESDGSIVDTVAATAVLPVLGRLVSREIATEGLGDVARRIEDQLQMLDEVRYYATPTDVEHHYIG